MITQEEITKQLATAKSEPKTVEEILCLISNARNMEEMDSLRGYCVTAKSRDILLAWQTKYRNMKTCPECGKIR